MSPPRRPPPPATIRIDRIGSEGDGIGRLPDTTPLYVPLTLPGEQVVARPMRTIGDGWQAEAETIEDRSDARVEPPCGISAAAAAVCCSTGATPSTAPGRPACCRSRCARAGFELPEPLGFHPGLPGERRRIDFAVRRAGGRIILGLHGPRSPEVIDLTDCLVLHPALMALMAPLRALLSGLRAVGARRRWWSTCWTPVPTCCSGPTRR